MGRSAKEGGRGRSWVQLPDKAKEVKTNTERVTRRIIRVHPASGVRETRGDNGEEIARLDPDPRKVEIHECYSPSETITTCDGKDGVIQGQKNGRLEMGYDQTLAGYSYKSLQQDRGTWPTPYFHRIF